MHIHVIYIRHMHDVANIVWRSYGHDRHAMLWWSQTGYVWHYYTLYYIADLDYAWCIMPHVIARIDLHAAKLFIYLFIYSFPGTAYQFRKVNILKWVIVQYSCSLRSNLTLQKGSTSMGLTNQIYVCHSSTNHNMLAGGRYKLIFHNAPWFVSKRKEIVPWCDRGILCSWAIIRDVCRRNRAGQLLAPHFKLCFLTFYAAHIQVASSAPPPPPHRSWFLWWWSRSTLHRKLASRWNWKKIPRLLPL